MWEGMSQAHVAVLPPGHTHFLKCSHWANGTTGI